jgi:hypothetical protein
MWWACFTANADARSMTEATQQASTEPWLSPWPKYSRRRLPAPMPDASGGDTYAKRMGGSFQNQG